jgi:hypothetical protein
VGSLVIIDSRDGSTRRNGDVGRAEGEILDAYRRGLALRPSSRREKHQTTEPSVIGWMPAAALYFRDPDGHLLEYLAMLEEGPNPDLGIVSWSGWLVQGKTSAFSSGREAQEGRRHVKLCGPRLAPGRHAGTPAG